MATITITVTVAGGKFVLDGVSQATYSATPGNTYKFDQSDSSNGAGGGHPLRLATAADAAGSSQYTTGVTTSGSPGSSGAYTQIEVTATTIQALFYYCSNHTGMGGSFNVGSSETVQYQDRGGFSVQNRSEDPLPYAKALEDNPYGGVWASGGDLNTARYRMVGGMGTQTAGYVVAGATPNKSNVESYNGTAWSETTDVPTATADNAAMGTATAGASIGGSSPTLNTLEIWNGASWTEGGTMPTGKTRMTAGGTTTAILAVGGAPPPGTYANTSLEYDGSSWTAGGTLPAIRGNGGQSGTQTAGFVFGGYSPSSGSTLSLTYNGSSFASTPGSLNKAFGESGFSVSGTQTDSWISGGTYPPSTATEYYDGSSWTISGDMAQKRQAGGSVGTGTLGLYAGGTEPSLSPTTTAVTEEFAFTGLPPSTPVLSYSSAVIGDIYYLSPSGQFKTVSQGVGTWSSGGSLTTARRFLWGAGTQTAGLAFGGYAPPGNQAVTELYDGSSWTETGDLSTARRQVAGGGTQTAGFAAGGYTTTSVADTEEFGGTSWTSGGALNTARHGLAGNGLQTAGLVYGGSGNVTVTEEYDGSSWTESGDLNNGRANLAGAGTQTAALAFGGPPGAYTEEYNGSSWTETSDMSRPGSTGTLAGFGTQTAAVGAGGYPVVGLTEMWDGTSWTEVGDLAVGRAELAGAGKSTQSAGLVFGGTQEPPHVAATEEFSFGHAIKTVTTS